MSGVEGTEITLTVSPDNFYRLKACTLKHGATAIDEVSLKFNLPSSNVTVTADFELKFIGAWQMAQSNILTTIYTFSENIFIEQFSDGKYRAKGTWGFENPNILFLQWTHLSSTGVETIDDLPEENILLESEFEFISDTFFKWYGLDFIFVQ
jgi:hypothetical protein